MDIMTDKKLLMLDIEWKPAKAYVWRMWKENISPAQLIDEGGMLCFCAHWHGSKDYMFWSEWEHGRLGMAEAAKALLEEADAVVTYNGDKYDLPKIRGEILLAGLTPPPTVTSIDVLKTIKGLGFVMNRLAYIGPLLGAGKKVSHEGFSLWSKVMDGDKAAQNRMRRYCIQDVRMLDRLYLKIRPFIKQHPHLGKTKHECGACGSNNVQLRGVRRTKFFRIQRIQCQHCGSWSEASREKIT